VVVHLQHTSLTDAAVVRAQWLVCLALLTPARLAALRQGLGLEVLRDASRGRQTAENVVDPNGEDADIEGAQPQGHAALVVERQPWIEDVHLCTHKHVCQLGCRPVQMPALNGTWLTLVVSGTNTMRAVTPATKARP
jgi:hypothetical protein